MSHTLLVFALASLPAASPLSLPEGVAKAPAAALGSLSLPVAPLETRSQPALPTSPAIGPGSASNPFGASSSSPSALGLAGGGLVIVMLGLATLWMQRRKRQGTRHIQVLETASLGPKRSLALVVVGRQSLLLSCCDSGIFLVSSQPATAEMLEGADRSAARVPVAAPPALRALENPPAEEGFAFQLAEAEETQGLRRRLSEAGVLR